MLSRASIALVRRSVPAAAAAGSNVTVPAATSTCKLCLSPSSTSNSNTDSSRTTGIRRFTTLQQLDSAVGAFEKSCYFEMDFTIPEEAMVFEAVQRFAAFNIGALVTVDGSGHISGVVSERDYINKIALLGRNSRETKVKEIATMSTNLLTASPKDSITECMQKMLSKDIRHLPLLDKDGKVIGMLSIKDLVKQVMREQKESLQVLQNFAMGRGGFYGGD